MITGLKARWPARDRHYSRVESRVYLYGGMNVYQTEELDSFRHEVLGARSLGREVALCDLRNTDLKWV